MVTVLLQRMGIRLTEMILSFLGLLRFFEMKGEHWRASDQEIEVV
jgi:hypothetical protein